MKYKIIVDSSCDLRNDFFASRGENEIAFEVIPLIVRIDDVDYVDDENLNVNELLKKLEKCNRASSSCPSPEAFEKACSADYNFIVTLSHKVSGSYNSALIGSKAVNEDSKKVFVIDSLGAAGIERLLVEKLFELISEGLDFEQIKQEIEKYRDGLNVFFNLTCYDNFVRKGRIKVHVAKIISIARIKVLCRAMDGDITIAKKCFTFNQCVKAILNEMVRFPSQVKKRKCYITFCGTNAVAENLASHVRQLNLFDVVEVNEARGLNAFYTLSNSIIASFD